MTTAFPIGRCRHCGQTFFASCVRCNSRRSPANDDAALKLSRAIDLLLAADLSVPGRSEAALRRLGIQE